MLKNARIGRLVAATALAVGATAWAAPANAAEGDAMVTVVHAVPDTPVDVYANGEALLTDFTPGTVTDPVALPAGSYDLKVTAPGAGADGKAVISADDVDVPAGANLSVVAHLTAGGDPVLTPYVNDVSAVPAGQARLTVRHTAAAPAVDVRAGGAPVFTGLKNPGEASGEVPAGTVSADVVLAGTDKVVIGPAELTLGEGSNTVVYAWGSADAGNLALAVQTIDGMGSAPAGVPGGTGGQAASDDAHLWWIALGVVAAGGAAALARTTGSRRA